MLSDPTRDGGWRATVATPVNAVVAVGGFVGALAGVVALDAFGTGPAFLLAFVTGVGVPQTYRRHWSRGDSVAVAARWGLVATAATVVGYVVAYRAAAAVVGGRTSAAVAFVVTYLALVGGVRGLAGRLRHDDGGDET